MGAIQYDLDMIGTRPGPAPKPEGQRFVRKTITLPPGLVRRIEAAAKKRGLSFSQVVAEKMSKGRV